MLRSCCLILIYTNCFGANGFGLDNKYFEGTSREFMAEAEIIYRLWREEDLANLSAVEFSFSKFI